MKILPGTKRPHHTDFCREMGVERPEPAIRFEAAIWHVRVGALTRGMHSRVGAPCTVDGDAHSTEGGKSFFEMVLYGVAIRLALPSRKARAVVGDSEAQLHGCASSQL